MSTTSCLALRASLGLMVVITWSGARQLARLRAAEPQAAYSCNALTNATEGLSAASRHFRVRSYCGGPSAREVALECERVYAELARYWFGESSEPTWSCPCDVVIHNSSSSYARAVPGAAGTLAATTVRSTGGRIVLRRIDVLATEPALPTSLAHELTHLLFVNRRPDWVVPRWLDEGLALMADTPQKQLRHWLDCWTAHRQGTALRLSELFTCQQPKTYDQATAFYGQSLALVAYLVKEKGPPEKLVEFADRIQTVGYDVALRECYGIDGLEELNRSWQMFVENEAFLNYLDQSVAIVRR
jgi:hypothetical protein